MLDTSRLPRWLWFDVSLSAATMLMVWFLVVPACAPTGGETPAPQDCNANDIEDAQEIAAGLADDCNWNNIPDECDIIAGLSGDNNNNGVPDECETDCNDNGDPDGWEIVSGRASDCNNNSTPDDCDIASGYSRDVDGNGVPDECETDCNGNDIFDYEDIEAGTSLDCNDNRVPDECDIAAGTAGDVDGNGIPDECEDDCNENDVLDSQDIANGTSQDCDSNGVPDECDIAAGRLDDEDDNGVPDTCETLYCENTLEETTITTDTTIPAGCWRVNENIYVSNNAVLTLSAGTTLQFADGTGLFVQSDGALSAEGQSDGEILLTGRSPTPGAWVGVEFNASSSDNNVLQYVTIEYAGSRTSSISSNLMLIGNASRVVINSCNLRAGGGYGLYLNQYAEAPFFSSNTLTSNANGAAYIHPAALYQLDADSVYSGNDVERIYVPAGATRADGTWPSLWDDDTLVTYLVGGTLSLNHHITLAPGVRLVFTSGVGCNVYSSGALTAVGSSTSPIYFTGAESRAGYWDGLQFFGTSSEDNRLQQAVIQYGGGSGSNLAANIMLTSTNPRLDVTDCTIRHSANWGVWVASSGTINATVEADNTFEDNVAGDFHQD